MDKKFSEKFKINELKLIDFLYWTLSVRPKQVTIGSLVISLKRNCHFVGEITEEESKELSIVFKYIEKLLKSAFQYNKINYICLMMVDKQVHCHVIPRYENTVIFNKKSYKDTSWPGPIEILKTIDEPGIEKAVLLHLQKKVIKQKVTVGYTTGVFDLFHIGHINILKRAKSECDYLIVGVTTDELSMQLKNKTPVIPFYERLEIIKSLRYVDEVVSQNTMDKFAAWEKYKFHKMFVGSDWKGTEKWNALEKDFSNVGVEIVYFPYTKSTSSTFLKSVLTKIS